ncbi:hypothetical protein AB3R30_23860 [Leptolyngbyaceae cyanobacterium UHCC 1019]
MQYQSRISHSPHPLREGFSIALISRATKLSVEAVQQLQQQIDRPISQPRGLLGEDNELGGAILHCRGCVNGLGVARLVEIALFRVVPLYNFFGSKLSFDSFILIFEQPKPCF